MLQGFSFAERVNKFAIEIGADMPVKIANMPNTPFQNSSIDFSSLFPASLENKDKSIIRVIFAVENSLSDFKKTRVINFCH